jgi:cathepsin L
LIFFSQFSSYPYHGVNEKCHYNKKTIGSTCSGFVDVATGDEDALKDALATVGPVSVAVDATQEKFMFYKEGVFVDDTCSNGQDDLDHGVLVVGYGTDNSTKSDGPHDYW